MVLQNDGLLRSQRFGDLSTLLRFQHDTGERVEQRVVLIEGAGVLCQRIKQTAERRPGLAVGRVGMGRGDYLRMRGMDRRMNHEAGLIDRLVTDQDVAVMVHELKIRDLDLAKELRQRIDPEAIREFRVAHGDMPGEALVEAVAREQAEGRGKTLLAVKPDEFASTLLLMTGSKAHLERLEQVAAKRKLKLTEKGIQKLGARRAKSAPAVRR